MKKILVVAKGYTITVNSWENDGDHWNTNEISSESKEYIDAVIELLDLIKTWGNDREPSDYIEQLKEWTIKNIKAINGTEDANSLSDFDKEDIPLDIIYELLDDSDYYTFRILNDYLVTYSEEDIYQEIYKKG
ncbi:MAG: hypothetical protein GY827_04675 [Cytophagales bacterium]|nr:hypothetical protein [Cytophagales bacterium]